MTKISLSAYVNEGTDAAPEMVKRKEEVYFCEVGDPEFILKTLAEFDDACVNDRLKLDDAA